MRAVSDQKYTLEEYFDLERNSEEKWEFWDGHVWCISGASIAHEDIVSNLVRSLGNRLADNCRVAGSNVRVKVPDFPPYRYPDLTIVCGKRETETISGLEMLLNPQAIIEVLSPSTEAFDRGDKFRYYKSITSLREYVLVTPDSAYITHLVLRDDNEWIIQDVVGVESVLRLPTFKIDVPLFEVYRGIEFPPEGYLHPENERSFQGR
jgi:Uma2 family endonuclease